MVNLIACEPQDLTEDEDSGYGQEQLSEALRLIGSWDGLVDEVPSTSRWQMTPQQTNPEIAISIAHPTNIRNESYRLLVAAPLGSESLDLCEGDCSASVRAFRAQKLAQTESRQFFVVPNDLLIEDGLYIGLVATSSDRKTSRQLQFVLKSRFNFL
jgi:hypothetical protein